MVDSETSMTYEKWKSFVEQKALEKGGNRLPDGTVFAIVPEGDNELIFQTTHRGSVNVKVRKPGGITEILAWEKTTGGEIISRPSLSILKPTKLDSPIGPFTFKPASSNPLHVERFSSLIKLTYAVSLQDARRFYDQLSG